MLQRCFIVCRVPKVVKSCTIALYRDRAIRRQSAAIRKTFYCQKTSKICCDSGAFLGTFHESLIQMGILFWWSCVSDICRSRLHAAQMSSARMYSPDFLVSNFTSFCRTGVSAKLCRVELTDGSHAQHFRAHEKLKVKFNFRLQTTFWLRSYFMHFYSPNWFLSAQRTVLQSE